MKSLANLCEQAAAALAIILPSSFYLARKWMYEFFLKLHFILAFITAFAILIHLLPVSLEKSVFPIATLSLWGFSTIIRLTRVIYYNSGGKKSPLIGQASIKHYFNGQSVSAMKIVVRPQRPLEIRPGQYVYLFLSDMGTRRRLQAHPYVISWWDDSMRATELCFLIQPQNGISSELIARNSLRKVIIDGPYGKDHHLEDYETVILVAKGIGIAGILPYIRHMTYRRASKDKENEVYRRGLITRKIDVYWVMENNCEEEWISKWISELQTRDSEKVGGHVCKHLSY